MRFAAVRFAVSMLLAAGLPAQMPAQIPASVPASAPTQASLEQSELSKAVAEAGQSPIDLIRALERHLAKYPQSAQKPAIEKALVKAATESNDRARIILYGERVLNAEPDGNDLSLIDRVMHALLETDDAESAQRALPWARRYEKLVESMRSRAAEGHMSEGQWSAEVDKAMARVLVLDARATGNSGHPEEALKIARRAWDSSPQSDAAREAGRWLAKLGQDAEAVTYYAYAFASDDSRTAEADRARDRARLGELYTRLNGSEKGLGDTILTAYDRLAAMRRERADGLKAKDPNAAAADLIDYTLPGVDGHDSLKLSSLKGKTVVMDFWATWCGPCRVQHPMIENVKKRFEKSDSVVFVSVDSDDDHSLVQPFLNEMHWNSRSYFDGGLGHFLNINSIPTVIVLDRSGKISSRMAGFNPGGFEDLLAERIKDAGGVEGKDAAGVENRVN